MTVKMPEIDIAFKQKAATLIERSERGYAIIIIEDETVDTPWKMYKEVTELDDDKANYTGENLQYLKDAFEFGTYRVCVARISSIQTVSNALKIIEANSRTGWIVYPEGDTEAQQTIATWIKTKEKNKQTYKAITYKATTTDCKHVVNFVNEKVTFVDSRAEVDGNKYLASLAGILASCNVEKGCTYFKCTNLERVQAVDDNDAELGKGNFILFNDVDVVRIAQGINSLTTLDGEDNTEDMQYIETVEAMDMMQDDIADVFKNEYLGNYKNKLDNQMLFIGSVNASYLGSLEDIDVLDEEYDNNISIDVDSQRKAWIASGKSEASDWDDATVRRRTFKRNLYLAGDVKVLGSMTNLKLVINLF